MGMNQAKALIKDHRDFAGNHRRQSHSQLNRSGNQREKGKVLENEGKAAEAEDELERLSDCSV